MMFDAIGIGAFYAVGALAAVTVLLLWRHELDAPILRTVGWSISLVGFCTLSEMLVPDWTPGPVVGSGGYLGTLVGGLLRLHFASVGGLVLAGSALMARLVTLHGLRAGASWLDVGNGRRVQRDTGKRMIFGARRWRVDPRLRRLTLGLGPSPWPAECR